MSLIAGAFEGFQISSAQPGHRPQPQTPAAPPVGVAKADQLSLSSQALREAPRFPQWSPEEQNFLKSLGPSVEGADYARLTRLLDEKLGAQLAAFVDLKSPELRDEVRWNADDTEHTAFELIGQVKCRGQVAEFAEKLCQGVDPAQLELYRPAPRELSEQDMSQLSALVAKSKFSGPELRTLHKTLLKQHGHDFRGYVTDTWPAARHRIAWETSATNQAYELLMHLSAAGHGLGGVAQKLLIEAHCETPSRNLGRA